MNILSRQEFVIQIWTAFFVFYLHNDMYKILLLVIYILVFCKHTLIPLNVFLLHLTPWAASMKCSSVMLISIIQVEASY